MAKQSTLVIPADPALLYEILTDYEHLAEWMPHVVRGRLLAQEGDLALAELEPGGKGNRRFAMECIHSPGRRVVWRPVERKIPITEFQWTLESAENGRCIVSAALERPISVARLFSGWSNLMQPEQCLEALKNHVSIFLPDDTLTEAGSEKILEILETETGLVCWLRGKKYRLVPESGT